MPFDSYHGHTRDLETGRRVKDLTEAERIRVSCARCGRTTIYGWETLRGFRFDCPLRWIEEMLKPSCYDLVKGMPADCVREVMWLDASPEDVGVSEEG